MKYVDKLEQLLAQLDDITDQLEITLKQAGVPVPRNNGVPENAAILRIAITARNAVNQYRQLDKEAQP